MGIDPGVSRLGGEIVSHNTTEDPNKSLPIFLENSTHLEEFKDRSFKEINRLCGLVGSAYDGTGYEFDFWQSVGYISHVH